VCVGCVWLVRRGSVRVCVAMGDVVRSACVACGVDIAGMHESVCTKKTAWHAKTIETPAN